MSVSFGGVGSVAATFKTSGTVKAGNPVKITADGTVAACASGERFCGIATYVSEDGHAAVQLKGFVDTAGSGTIAVGYARLIADGNGGVKADSGEIGGECLVVSAASGGKVGFIM